MKLTYRGVYRFKDAPEYKRCFIKCSIPVTIVIAKSYTPRVRGFFNKLNVLFSGNREKKKTFELKEGSRFECCGTKVKDFTIIPSTRDYYDIQITDK